MSISGLKICISQQKKTTTPLNDFSIAKNGNSHSPGGVCACRIEFLHAAVSQKGEIGVGGEGGVFCCGVLRSGGVFSEYLLVS